MLELDAKKCFVNQLPSSTSFCVFLCPITSFPFLDGIQDSWNYLLDCSLLIFGKILSQFHDTHAISVVLQNLFVCVSDSFHNSRPHFIVQLVHDIILLINVKLQSITKHPKTWVGRKKQNETCAENSKLSDLEVIKQIIMHSQHSSGHRCTTGYLPFVIMNLYSLHQNKCRVLQLFLPLCSELGHAAHLPSFFVILEIFLAGTIQGTRFSSPASWMCSSFLIPYSIKASTKSSFSPIMRSLFSAQIMEEMHVCTPRRIENPILLQLTGASAKDHERRSLDTSIPSTSSTKQHPPARAAVHDNQLEFIGRKIMNYLTNIINLWKPLMTSETEQRPIIERESNNDLIWGRPNRGRDNHHVCNDWGQQSSNSY